jgi:hypothetical protein
MCNIKYASSDPALALGTGTTMGLCAKTPTAVSTRAYGPSTPLP